ncbi:MAG: hypothetical protein E6H78_21425 [Betaproteobacteria bacterium]|nr:MAG: hypothetical protein E6H78_21425 [Betaproteobacteria bacterium]
MNILRTDGELVRDELRRGIQPQPIQPLHVRQSRDCDDAPRVDRAIARASQVEARGQHPRTGGSFGEDFDDDVVTVACE